ncbi:MAG: DNA repair protein RecO [Oscillospiraceae bacterium]|nr:DNA repair protein RecO [Oscillospiraceae bacterium]
MRDATLSGIVLRESQFGESDKYVTLLTHEVGLIDCMAKRARKAGGALAAGTQPFCYCRYTVFEGRERTFVRGCDITESFYGLRNDLRKLTYSCHFADIAMDIAQEGEPNEDLLSLLLNALHLLDKTDRDPEAVKAAFEMRAACVSGYRPEAGLCGLCGSKGPMRAFDFGSSAFLCGGCLGGAMAGGRVVALTPGAASGIARIIGSEGKGAYGVGIPDDCLREISEFAHMYLCDKMEREYGRLAFLGKIT